MFKFFQEEGIAAYDGTAGAAQGKNDTAAEQLMARGFKKPEAYQCASDGCALCCCTIWQLES